MIVRTDTGIPKGNDAHTLVRIIGGLDDGRTFPAAQVLTPAWEVYDADEMADGWGAGEFETGARCRIIRLSNRNTNREYWLDRVFEYNGWQWLPVKGGE